MLNNDKITQLKESLERVSQVLIAAEKEKNRLEARMDSLKEQREKEVTKLKELGVSSPKDLDEAMGDISGRVKKVLDKVKELKPQLPQEILRELNGAV